MLYPLSYGRIMDRTDKFTVSRYFFRYPWWHYLFAAIAIALIMRFSGGTTPAF